MNDALQGLKPFITKAAARQPLDLAEADEAFNIIMSGEATPSQIGGFLMALAVRGETVDEIAGGAKAMRAKMHRMSAPAGAMDIVGTGGDGMGTLNISTATALVVAGCGVTVAKHGNRAASSKSGAADVLSMSGVDLEADYDVVQRAIDEGGIGFMVAPRYHSAMRHVMPSRVELGARTVFNLLGPLSNPAEVKLYLLGVFAAQWVEPMAEVLGELGAERAWVVHSGDGCDELTLSADNTVAVLDKGSVTMHTVRAADAGLAPQPFETILGGSPEENAKALAGLLAGDPGTYRDTVLFNAAPALIVAGKAADLAEGVAQAAQSIDSGAARDKLARLAAITSGGA
ncbi:MAG: anthranilate phosphoribosyltransferase [Rhodospirillales bacterium]|nr:anthranilate phosphoribosyltransferase [Rhodospirillales bacterium]